MQVLGKKHGNGCFWVAYDNGEYLVKVEDGIDLDPTNEPMRFKSAREAFDSAYWNYEQSYGMELHAWWNVCSALEESLYREEAKAA
jgi:hypothetical protein